MQSLARGTLAGATLLLLGVVGVVGVLGAPAGPALAEQESLLYVWTDAEGVVRYTPDPDRVPRARRSSMRRVAPGMALPPAAKAAPAVRPGPRVAPGSREATGAAREPGGLPPDPFNAPGERRRIESRPVPEPPAPTRGEAPPGSGRARAADPDPRIAELEAAVARDEEALKQLLDTPAGEGTDVPAELREIARRLPQLQRELESLRAQRDARDR